MIIVREISTIKIIIYNQVPAKSRCAKIGEKTLRRTKGLLKKEDNLRMVNDILGLSPFCTEAKATSHLNGIPSLKYIN